ncbi:MAG: hypothetical protein ACE5EM_05915 [Sphingomonadales bacterium]
MNTTGLVIKTRKKMNRMIIGLVVLLVAEFFGLLPLIGPLTFVVMLLTFIGGIWLGNRIAGPLLEMGEEAITQAVAKESREGQNH